MDADGNAIGYIQQDENSQGARRRYGEGVDHDHNGDEGVDDELNRLRGIVDRIEGERSSGGLKLGLNNAAMSTIFGFMFVAIITMTFYLFFSLYRALSKRFFPAE